MYEIWYHLKWANQPVYVMVVTNYSSANFTFCSCGKLFQAYPTPNIRVSEFLATFESHHSLKRSKIQNCSFFTVWTILKTGEPHFLKAVLHFELSWLSAELWAVKGSARVLGELTLQFTVIPHKSPFDFRKFIFGPNEHKFGPNILINRWWIG